MLATVKKIRTVRPPTHGEIPPGKIEANTPEWRARVLAELAKRPRGEQARIAAYVQRWYPKFSTGTLSATLADDEKPGQLRHSKYIPLINRYLWPNEFAEMDPTLESVIRTMPLEEQRALAEFLKTTRKQR